jgi:hypothetical protein
VVVLLRVAGKVRTHEIFYRVGTRFSVLSSEVCWRDTVLIEER